MNTEQSPEQAMPKEFGFNVSRVDRTLGHVYIEYSGRTYKWFLREEDSSPILITGDEHDLTDSVRHAMRTQVRAILGPTLRAS